MVYGERGDHHGRFGMVPFLLDVLTTCIDKSKGKEGNRLFMEFSWVLDDWLSGLFL